MRPKATRLAGVVFWVTVGCACGVDSEPVVSGPVVRADSRPVPFREVTDSLLPVASEPAWPEGRYALTEIMGGGVALFDYDADGDLDLLEARQPPPGAVDRPSPNRLFEQQPDGRFIDVSERSGLGDSGFGQGIAIGDVEGDGDLDVYFTNLGRDALYLNNGDGTFRDATAGSEFTGDEWSTSALFTDVDRDGDLDLFVVHYVDYDPAIVCEGMNLDPDYCGPQVYPPSIDHLYINDGAGVFENVGAERGITRPGKGLGIVAFDANADGWVDLYVANDGEVNHLWINDGDGAFVEEALVRGVALNASGRAEASMGVAVGDVDGDGSFDLFTTHLRTESNTLYTRAGGHFFDRSGVSGFERAGRTMTGFGCGMLDFDHDGDLDLVVANGRVTRGTVLDGAGLGPFWNFFAEPDMLYVNAGGGRFDDSTDDPAGFSGRMEISRGLTQGDLDRDGDLDLVIGRVGGHSRIYLNDAPPSDSHWLIVDARSDGVEAIGAEVELVVDGRTLRRLVQRGYSYASSQPAEVHFGFGAGAKIEHLSILWPDQVRERFDVPGVDRRLVIRRGGGATQ